jgi:hypothetical protein
MSFSKLNFIDWLSRNKINVAECNMRKVAREYAHRDKREDKTPVMLSTRQAQN